MRPLWIEREGYGMSPLIGDVKEIPISSWVDGVLFEKGFSKFRVRFVSGESE